MALALYDRVQQTGTANTTVSFTLSGTVTGFQSFSVIGNTNTTYYAATDSSGNWEVGLGTYSTTGPTLTRTTIYSSSNSGSAVTFSGSVNVFVTYPAGTSVVSGNNYGSSGQVLTSGGTGVAPTWTTPTTGTVTSITAGTGLSGGTITTTGTIAIDSTVATLTGTQTLTNKRVNPRAVAAGATSGTLTPNGDTTDVFNAFGLTGSITVATPSGTPVDGQRLMLRFEDNGTGRGITWTTSSGAYRAVGATLPTTTVASKVIYVGCVYNSTDVFWDVVAVAEQA
jgi:hypothetical protein